ncbi:tRNA (adenosine(37)-N6)-threonylcarbamoyltransferase complex dimerization subunit type 1 TsaB [Francisella adeliensis]|uniref:tRNA threonylcarbamoyladenosine biosynthesis protein TsaB n=1 Tax=Francisella adeliensis TaxID=2007306 RepID=A0A2Z4XY75_9GAMM|nr:tRNA (adenosine(37)-N6)-threonylcarbamoyltransferase complex dimerization subunit type 1 TsaB [Francisella adeliensis]AXA33739.1 tRNA (adenosine(37)-N6)-threonylcarbamoyltransferase complex dimerization subunit type 1 TsaB [Francisella adeliensis]MBK2085636.1 tRNA (adenosine(37)-N6)-threonylcarbamoyltransferase complex dimerization subunit type 1 TsaB [Francisella adeliensis]MBK2097514.1 tRNA (adenosine(37)-N6)-threonylcarbamoyltransferase complex dimerization subunit type 1 TsaB [Francisella
MKFLVLDTSTSYCSVALSVDGQVYSDTRYIPRQHNKYLLQMIEDLFAKAELDKKALDFIAYGVGPGSFVGVRLAASVAQAFAVSCDIPIVGFSSMFAIAKSNLINADKVAVVLDAKMGDFYLGLYDKASDSILSENVYKLEEWTSELYQSYYLVGDAISQVELIPDLTDFKLDVINIINYVETLYNTQKTSGKLTHETYPVYLRGTSHWKKKGV